MDAAAIVGVVLGSCIFIAILIVVVKWMIDKKDKQQESREETAEGSSTETFIRRQHKH